MPSIYHNMINLVFSIEIRGSPSRLVDIKVLVSGATDNHILCASEGYQSEAIVPCFLAQTVFSDYWAKNTFSSHIRVKIIGIPGCVIFILRWRMGTYKGNVKI